MGYHAALLLCFGLLGGEAKKPSANPLAEAIESAERDLKAGKLERALIGFRKVIFCAPSNGKALRGEQEATKLLVAKLIQEGESAWEKDAQLACKRFEAASRLSPQSSAVKSALSKKGFQLHQGRWRTKEATEAFKAQDRRRGEERLKKLKLGAGFRVVRFGPFRFMTDTAEKSSRFQQMVNAIEAHYQEYLRAMRVFSPVEPEEGLDVVLFNKEEDYRRITSSEGSVGVYIPRRGVSYFYVTKEGEDFATLLHEMTHQLNDKLTSVLGSEDCVEEGMAEYFSVGQLTDGGKRLKIGALRGDRLTDFRDAVRRGRSIPLENLFHSAEPTDDLFYPESYALVHYLMEVHPLGRSMLYDLLASTQQIRRLFRELEAAPGEAATKGTAKDRPEEDDDDEDDEEEPDDDAEALLNKRFAKAIEALPIDPVESFKEVLERHRLDYSKLEKDFFDYVRNAR